MANIVDIVIRGVDRTKQAFQTPIKNLGDIKKAAIALKPAMLAAGAAIGFVGAMLAKTAANEARVFGKAMGEVSTLLDDTSAMDGLTQAVKKMSVEFGKAPEEEAKALYQIISAGASDAATAMDLLTASNKLAIGGVTSVEVAADGLTTLLNAYGDAAGGATNVTDALFVAMKAGKTTIEQLSVSIGKVAPLAVQAGVSMDELLAAASAITKIGVKTKESMTGLRAVLAAIAKPSSQAAVQAKALGLEFSAAGLKSMGFAKFLEHLKEKTKLNTTVFGQLFGGVEALIPIMQLTGKGAKDFADILENMGKKAGETEKAFKKMEQTADFKFDRLKAAFKVIGIVVGNAILDVMIPAVDLLLENFESVDRGAHALGNSLRFLGRSAIGVGASFDIFGTQLGGVAAIMDRFISEDPNLPSTVGDMLDIVNEEVLKKIENYGKILAALESVEYDPKDKLPKNMKTIIDIRAAMAALRRADEEVGGGEAPEKLTQEYILADKTPGGMLSLEMERDKIWGDIIEKQKKGQKVLGDSIVLSGGMLSNEAEVEKHAKAIYEWSQMSADARFQYFADLGMTGEAIREINEGLGEQIVALSESDALLSVYTEAWAGAHKTMKGYLADIGDATLQAFSDMGDAITDFVVDGKASFSDFAKSVMKDMIRIAIQAAIIQPLLGAFSGIFGPAASASSSVNLGGGGYSIGGPYTFPGRAAGGPVMAGGTYVVGEKGPELLRTASAGYVHPMGGGGGPQKMRVEIVNNSSQQMEVSDASFQFNFQESVVTVVLDAISRNAYGMRTAVGR